MGKTLLVYDMNLREMENYEKIYKDIGKHEKMLLISVWEMNKVKPGEHNIYIWWVVWRVFGFVFFSY